MQNRAVVTGVGVLAANGIGKDAFWKSMLEGRSGIGPITLFDASDLPCRIAGEVRHFNPSDFIDPSRKPEKRMGRFTQLGLAAARLAIEDAGIQPEYLARMPNLSVVVGVSTSALDLRSRKPGLFTAVEGVPHAVTSAIGYTYHTDPRLLTISDGCASSLDSVAKAAEMIRLGKADLVIAGGAEGSIDHYVVEIMLKCRRCSTRNECPEKASRPFDRDRDYGVMAEGAGIVVLENLNHALGRGARIYGEITGYGTCADHITSEEGSGLAESMALAMANAGIREEQVDHISAHGPSDIDMDVTETNAIKQVFGNRAYRIPVVSIKGVVGCPMGSGGVMQLITAALTIHESRLPPTANYENPDPKCDLDYVPEGARRADVCTALINTHGFGRGNGTMVLRRFDHL